MLLTKPRFLAALTLLTVALAAGCANYVGAMFFFVNSSKFGWEGSIGGKSFRELCRSEDSKRIQFRIEVRTDQPESNYLLTLEAASDGKGAHITVDRGAEFPSSTPPWPSFDFLEDMSDGKIHEFDLQKSSAHTTGILKLRFVR